jgi:hypothetical protein
MFANTQMGGMDLAFPDVCLTPAPPPAPPVPLPYPNMANRPAGVPAVYNVLWGGAPAHSMSTTIPVSSGDNPGISLGVASGVVMGPSRCTTGATTVLVGGMPATRLTSTTMQNNTNAPGVSLAPSQVKVLLLAP